MCSFTEFHVETEDCIVLKLMMMQLMINTSMLNLIDIVGNLVLSQNRHCLNRHMDGKLSTKTKKPMFLHNS